MRQSTVVETKGRLKVHEVGWQAVSTNAHRKGQEMLTRDHKRKSAQKSTALKTQALTTTKAEQQTGDDWMENRSRYTAELMEGRCAGWAGELNEP